MPLSIIELTWSNKAARAVWAIVYVTMFRHTPVICHFWRRLLLKCFGAKLQRNARVYPLARVWAPWNLSMDENSVIGNDVDCYSVAPVSIGRNAVVSQYAHICTASHDYRRLDFPTI